MRDLTERALDTATSLGAGYADARVVRRLDESVAIKTGRVEGVASNESEGFGVRVVVDGAWGFASSHVLEPRRGRSGRGRRGPHRPGQCDRPARAGRSRYPARSDRVVRDADRGGPVRGPDRAQDRRPAGRRPGRRAHPRHRVHGVDVRGPARVEDVRRHRRLVHRADHHPRRVGGRGQRRRRRRASAPVLPGLRRRLAGRGLRVHPRSRSRRHGRSRWPRRPSPC